MRITPGLVAGSGEARFRRQTGVNRPYPGSQTLSPFANIRHLTLAQWIVTHGRKPD